MSKALNKKPLPSKEASLFKDLLTLYETRQLKKGLKTADAILKKFPDNGETMAMKGLILTHMGKRDEGIDLVKKGVRLDLMSHIVWHVFGLIQKAEKKYEEALKSYTQALRFDKDNMNLLRDSAQLQTHLRLYDNLVDTRHTILRLRPNLRQNWTALAVAHSLNGHPEEARKVLEHYRRSLKNVPDYDVEHSETLLYYIAVLEHTGDYAEALSVLDASSRSRSIVDRTAILQARARILSKLGSEDAPEAWRTLIQHNSENYAYYRGYLETQGVSFDEPNEKALSILSTFASQLPKARAPRRLMLTHASGTPQFQQLARDYIEQGLTKGIPSLFSELKSLYPAPSSSPSSPYAKNAEIIQSIGEDLLSQFSSSSSTSSSTNPVESDPTAHLWTLYLLSQHYSHLSNHTKALELLSTAITHTPTLPELYMIRAKILKRAGDPIAASKSMNEARLLDGQDRFLNTKTGKYLLRADMPEEAYTIFGMFTKKDAPSPAADLEDMQSLLFLIEDADAYKRLGKPNLAVKKYVGIKKVFEEFEDDQFDFHGYNLRKFTLNIYLNMHAWENRLRSHPLYARAAVEAARILVAVHDDPSIHADLVAAANQLTDAEKKAKKKARKAIYRQQDEKRTGPKTNDLELQNQATDDDPDGMKLLGSVVPSSASSAPPAPAAKPAANAAAPTPDGMGLVAKMLNEVVVEFEVRDKEVKEGKRKRSEKTEERAKEDALEYDVWIACYDVAIRRKKLLQAVRALERAQQIRPESGELHLRLVDLHQRAKALPQEPPAPIGPVFTEQVTKLVPTFSGAVSLETWNSQYLQKHAGKDAEAVLGAAKAAFKIGEALDAVEKIVFQVLDAEGVSIEVSLSCAEFLTQVKSSRVPEFKVKAQERFPLSTVFKPAEEQAKLRQAVLTASSSEEESVETSPVAA